MKLLSELWKVKMETNPKRMDKLSTSTFKDIYPLIAGQIVERCGIKNILVGSGIKSSDIS
jgi:hypothetical protein